MNLVSRHSDDDIAYSREFQRNRYLTENPSASKDYLNSPEQLARLGIRDVNRVPTAGYDKRAPHAKYYY